MAMVCCAVLTVVPGVWGQNGPYTKTHRPFTFGTIASQINYTVTKSQQVVGRK